MAVGKSVFWLKEIDRENDLEFYILGYHGNKSGGHDLEAWIAPNQGSNLCRLAVDGRPVIDFDRSLLKVDFTGTPVLYPTPNRVRDGVFHYQNKTYRQVKRSNPVYEHGLVYNEAWQRHDPEIVEDGIVLRTWIDFNPDSPLYEAFPFEQRLKLDFRLTGEGIRMTYTIENKGSEAIPFGFGFHPYFMKLCGDEETYVKVPARYVMETTPDLLPTGTLMDVSGTRFDLRAPVALEKLDLDHVFTGTESNQRAQVIYPPLGLRVEIAATEDFSYFVLYSPAGAGFFCLEAQTCSTDAHNLYNKHFIRESGLKFVPPGASQSGSVSYLFKTMEERAR